jgi:hypothetical protein
VATQNPERKAVVKAQVFAIGGDWLLLLWLREGAPADARRDRGRYAIICRTTHAKKIIKNKKEERRNRAVFSN